jgi:hypothetical protein
MEAGRFAGAIVSGNKISQSFKQVDTDSICGMVRGRRGMTRGAANTSFRGI